MCLLLSHGVVYCWKTFYVYSKVDTLKLASFHLSTFVSARLLVKNVALKRIENLWYFYMWKTNYWFLLCVLMLYLWKLLLNLNYLFYPDYTSVTLGKSSIGIRYRTVCLCLSKRFLNCKLWFVTSSINQLTMSIRLSQQINLLRDVYRLVKNLMTNNGSLCVLPISSWWWYQQIKNFSPGGQQLDNGRLDQGCKLSGYKVL